MTEPMTPDRMEWIRKHYGRTKTKAVFQNYEVVNVVTECLTEIERLRVHVLRADGAERAVVRWQHGEQIESDYIDPGGNVVPCPHTRAEKAEADVQRLSDICSERVVEIERLRKLLEEKHD